MEREREREREREIGSSRRRDNRRLLKILGLFNLSRYLVGFGVFWSLPFFPSSLSSLFSSS